MMVVNCNRHFCTEEKEKFEEYAKAIEAEREKILVFQRELPLSLELVTQAIEACKRQLSGTTTGRVGSESDEQIIASSKLGPVLEELIPVERTWFEDEDHSHSHSHTSNRDHDDNNMKSEWLKSVQLWNHTQDSPTQQDLLGTMSDMQVTGDGSGSAFSPFKREKKANSSPKISKPPLSAPNVVASSRAEIGECSGSNKKDEKEGQRKVRRSWSAELHKRFLHAIQQLGGSQVATPKQIREIMKVDGLTNDEVKSHLQKYRLHERRPSPSIHNNDHPQTAQFVVVGGIWVPPPEHAVVLTAPPVEEASRTTTANKVYAPIAAPLPQHSHQGAQFNANEKPRQSEDRVNCSSPASSSTTHATAITQSS